MSKKKSDPTFTLIMPPDLKHAFFPTAEAKVEDIDRDKKELVVRISTDTIDRDGEILLPKGLRTTDYRKNPVVLYAHQYDQLPIARSLWEKPTSKDVIARPKFSQKNEFSMQVFDLYEEEILRAWSMGFKGCEGKGHSPTEDEIKARPEWAGAIWIFEEWDLWEYSAVPVPSNPDALALAIKTGAKSIPPSILADMNLPDVGEPWPYQKPYPNEHACRKRDPGDFQEDSFRRMEREHDGKTYSVIMGRLTGETTLTEQAYRYPKETWTPAEARSHCKAHEGSSFEAAKDIRDAELLAGAVCESLLITRKPLSVVRIDAVQKMTEAARKGRVTFEP